MNIIQKIINTGTKNQESYEIPRIRLVNGIILFSMIMVFFYTISYLTIFPSQKAVLYNVIVIAELLFCYFLTAKGHYIASRIFFGLIFMIQFLYLTLFVFEKTSGIHLFYISIAPISFLLFDFNNRFQRYTIYSFSLISILLFYFCQSFPDILSFPPLEEFHYRVSAISLIVALFITSWIFSKEMNKATKQLNVLATTDGLSGILNRRSFFIHGTRIINQSAVSKKSFALILLDLDHFKKINDTYGHPAGDKVIQEFANTIRDDLRTSDIFARLGGEEFGIILPETDMKGAKKVAEEIRSVFEGKVIVVEQNQHISCTVSIGITCGDGSNNNFDLLLANCDKALYKSKTSGRNRITFLPQPK